MTDTLKFCPPQQQSCVEWVLFAKVTSQYFVGTLRVSSLVNRLLAEQGTREAFLSAFWNSTGNLDTVMGIQPITSLWLINQLLSWITPQASPFRGR
ncbi:MAG: hypothetical protein ACFFCQ_06095 [Promethearchaeota archaeon]